MFIQCSLVLIQVKVLRLQPDSRLLWELIFLQRN